MRRVLAVTCARSDFGLMTPVFRAIEASVHLELELCATGMHLSERFGHTVDEIEAEGFDVAHRVPTLDDDDSELATTRAIGRGIAGFGALYAEDRPDVVLVLGDRFDMFPAAVAALPFRIPVAHVSGGDVSWGAIDDALRHCITKLAHLHLPSNELSARRIEAMGEDPGHVRVVGAPGLDLVRDLDPMPDDELARRFGFIAGEPCYLVTFHPVTLELERTAESIASLLEALDRTPGRLLFTYPNADPASRVVIAAIEAFVAANRDRARVVVNAGQRGYLSLMNRATAMVGNSSSGIVEAASFGLPAIDVGNRQRGRLAGRNVIRCPDDANTITRALSLARSEAFRSALTGLENPYGDGRTAPRVVEALESLVPANVVKEFNLDPRAAEARPVLAPF